MELSRTPDVVELFLRDRATIFSPIVQTRILLSDYIKELGGNEVPINPPSPLPVQSPTKPRKQQALLGRKDNSALFAGEEETKWRDASTAVESPLLRPNGNNSEYPEAFESRLPPVTISIDIQPDRTAADNADLNTDRWIFSAAFV